MFILSWLLTKKQAIQLNKAETRIFADADKVGTRRFTRIFYIGNPCKSVFDAEHHLRSSVSQPPLRSKSKYEAFIF